MRSAVDITSLNIGNTLEKAYGSVITSQLFCSGCGDQGMLGRKTGAGFYKYEGKKQTPNESLTQWRRGLHGEPEGAEGPNYSAGLASRPAVTFESTGAELARPHFSNGE